MNSLKNLLGHRPPKKPSASGITVLLLQHRLERFTTEKLNVAMQQAWKKPYDETNFYAVNLNDEGAVFKLNSVFYLLTHHERRLGADELGEVILPEWAFDCSFSLVSAAFPEGIPDDLLPRMYGFMGLLVAELISPDTAGLYFKEAGIFVRNIPELITRLKAAEDFMPKTLPGV